MRPPPAISISEGANARALRGRRGGACFACAADGVSCPCGLSGEEVAQAAASETAAARPPPQAHRPTPLREMLADGVGTGTQPGATRARRDRCMRPLPPRIGPILLAAPPP